ncbi:FtsX-like permease family protein [Microbacterium binotii]|uniref:FtsX-like permease family protein n=1 Tax=Microbacterium binotii TaxID=462710 RepID=UPI001F445117|nr:FtsX-like permease family protein [Microbacterium binotii]UIN30199.1 permease [Microbacterium binotii]
MSAVATQGAVRRTLTLSRLLARPSRQSRAALVLPIVAFATTTTLLLIVAGGTRMFLTDDRGGAFTGMYGILAVLALVLLAVPLATLGAAAARLSSRRRDDRLATLRLLGATSGEVAAMTVIEAAATAAVGAVAGAIGYVAVLPLVGLLPFFGGPIGAGAAWAGFDVLTLVLVGVVALATVSATLGLRRVALTPLGVRRRSDPAPRRRVAVIVGVIGAAAVAVLVLNLSSIGQLVGPAVSLALLLALFAGSLGLLNLVGTPIVAARGRAMARRAGDAAHLIAGRELAAHASVAWRRVSAIAMVSFIAVVGGAGMSLVALAGGDTADSGTVFADIRTGVLVTLVSAFLLLACSVGVTQAASVLEDRELIVGLDRLGVPATDLARARRITVLLPLRWAALGGALAGIALSLPVIGITLVLAPTSLLIIGGTFAVGIALVLGSLASTEPLVRAIRRAAA